MQQLPTLLGQQCPGGATMVGVVVASLLAVVCKRMQQVPTMLVPREHRGKDTTHKTLLT